MSLKAGWIAFFIFVWVIGAFLGSTFDYQEAEAAQGQTYSTGTATFTNASDVVTSGGGAVWVAGMEDGNIQSDTDQIWCKIKYVGAGYMVNNSGIVTGSPLTLAVGANAPTVTQLGTLIVVLPPGNTGTATSGVCTVVGSPQALVAGSNTVTTTGVVGGISIATVGNTVIFLYSAYSGTGGAGHNYTMRPTPGWAGVGTGGYTTSPLNTLQNLMYTNQVEQRNALIGTFAMLISPDFWEAAFDIITWQWSFCNPSNYGMFYWIILFPFVAMGLLCILLLVYGVVTGNLTW